MIPTVQARLAAMEADPETEESETEAAETEEAGVTHDAGDCNSSRMIFNALDRGRLATEDPNLLFRGLRPLRFGVQRQRFR